MGTLTREPWGFFYLSWKFLDQGLPPIQSIIPRYPTYIAEIIKCNYEGTVE